MTDAAIATAEHTAPAGPTAAPAVRIQGLTKRYGTTYAVRDLDLDVARGEVFGLIGPNGAGKTTTFAVLASLLRPTAGRVEVLGVDPSVEPFEVRRHLGYMPDVLGVYDDLSVQEYLGFFAAAYRIPRRTHGPLIDGLLELVDLDVKRDAYVNSLSRGMKQRLSLARALIHDPEVLILDEPASGLDPRARVELRSLLVELREMGKTIVISSHILSELAEMCTSIGIMEKGALLASGSPATIRATLGGARTVRVTLAGGEVHTYPVDDDDAKVALLRRLVVDEELPVVDFSEAEAGLEDLFMRITTGEVG